MSEALSHIHYCESFLQHPRLADEPVGDDYRGFQEILDVAYAHKAEGRLDEAFSLLQHNSTLPQTPHQQVRSLFLQALFCIELDNELDKRGVPDSERVDDPLGAAIEYLASAAQIAGYLPDGALAAWFKSEESRLCYGSNPYRRRYKRACGAAQNALETWQQISDRASTDDLHFEFSLADAVGVRAQMVAEDDLAVHGLEQAALLLLKLRDRKDLDKKQYLNDTFFLDWNWAAFDHAHSRHKLALMRALKARNQAPHSLDRRNIGRVNALIAEIALDCVDNDITWNRYNKPRLLNVAEAAKDNALDIAAACGDGAGYVLALLVKVRWIRETRWREERHTDLAIAEKLAAAVLASDPLLYARVEIGSGDEYAFLYRMRKTKKRLDTAQRYFRSAEKRLNDIEALSLEHVARKRLVYLLRDVVAPKPRGRRKRKPPEPPSDPNIPSLN